jgi:hypothetical protein
MAAKTPVHAKRKPPYRGGSEETIASYAALFLRKLYFCRCKLVEDPLALVLVHGVTQLGPLS